MSDFPDYDAAATAFQHHLDMQPFELMSCVVDMVDAALGDKVLFEHKNIWADEGYEHEYDGLDALVGHGACFVRLHPVLTPPRGSGRTHA